MAIKIQTQAPEVPVLLGELEFSIPATDEYLKSFRLTQKEFLKELDQMDKKDSYEEDYEQSMRIVKKAYESLLGEGAFDKAYKQTPSIIILTKYFGQIAEGLEEEFKNMGLTQSQNEKVNKYLKQKKK
ncbi:hypothetical protein [Alkalihalophilus marmarensis]|uniref:hypothetical protein n=1 Tax=Alkalihalophilus marmarensis TaxID=521377 RepID=UPI002E1D144C|nr:hypothetical protein [Alkalihalophilus marmarensis]